MTKPLKSENQTISEQITDAVNGTDEVMEVAHPGATPLLVMASYPIVLLLVISLALCYYAFFPSQPKHDSNNPSEVKTPNVGN